MVDSAIFMKITTYIDGPLLKKALRASHCSSQREVLEEGLRNLLADIQRKSFLREFDRLRLNLNLKTLKQQRA